MHTAESRESLDHGRLRRLVDSGGLMWRRINVVDETGSTNADLLARAVAGDNIDGAVLLAEYQTAGRGRHGRSWTAPPRSQVAMSLGVGTSGIPSSALGWLPLVAGVAVVDALSEAAAIKAGLKWPNDVLVGGRKIAGILAEVAPTGAAVVLGLGLNVSMTSAEAPDPNATSLAMLGRGTTDRSSLVEAVLAQLSDRIRTWRSSGGATDVLAADYRLRSVTLRAQVRAALPGGRFVEGVATDIDPTGRLQIHNGFETVTVAAGDITHLRPVKP